MDRPVDCGVVDQMSLGVPDVQTVTQEIQLQIIRVLISLMRKKIIISDNCKIDIHWLTEAIHFSQSLFVEFSHIKQFIDSS